MVVSRRGAGAARRLRCAASFVCISVLAALGGCTNAYVRPTSGPVWRLPERNTVPGGTLASAQINQKLSTETSRAGDRFTVELLDPLLDGNGQEVVARGAIVDGVIRGTKRSRTAGESAELDLQLIGLEQPGETVLPAPLEIAQTPVELTSVIAREVAGGVIGAAAGAGVGVGINSNSAGVVVGSTFIGLGLGVLAGYVFGLRDAELPVGSVVTLRLTHDFHLDHPVAAAWSRPYRPSEAAASTPTPAPAPETRPVTAPVPAGQPVRASAPAGSLHTQP
jgi:hypothetical protein